MWFLKKIPPWKLEWFIPNDSCNSQIITINLFCSASLCQWHLLEQSSRLVVHNVQRRGQRKRYGEKKICATAAGFEPARQFANTFRVYHLNHSVKQPLEDQSPTSMIFREITVVHYLNYDSAKLMSSNIVLSMKSSNCRWEDSTSAAL